MAYYSSFLVDGPIIWLQFLPATSQGYLLWAGRAGLVTPSWWKISEQMRMKSGHSCSFSDQLFDILCKSYDIDKPITDTLLNREDFLFPKQMKVVLAYNFSVSFLLTYKQSWRNCCEGLRPSFPVYVAPWPPPSDLRNILNKTHAMEMRHTLVCI